MTSVEINPILIFIQRLKNLTRGKKVKILRQNFAELDMSTIDRAFLYWQPQAIDEHFPGIFRRAKKGTLFVSYFYSFPDSQGADQREVELSNGDRAYTIKK